MVCNVMYVCLSVCMHACMHACMYVCISANREATSQASLSKSSVGYTPLFSTFACVWEWAHATPNWMLVSMPSRVCHRAWAAGTGISPHRRCRWPWHHTGNTGPKAGFCRTRNVARVEIPHRLAMLDFVGHMLDIFDSRKRANISIFVMIFRPSKIPVQPKALLQRGKQTILSVLDMLKVWSKAPLPSLRCLWRASASIGLNSSTNQSMPFSCP